MTKKKKSRMDIFKKYGMTPVENNSRLDELEKIIEKAVSSHRHMEQLDGCFILMQGKQSISEITSTFKNTLATLSRQFNGKVSSRDICAKIGYSENLVLNILEYLGNQIKRIEENDCTYYSIN